MANIIGVRFKKAGKIYFFDPAGNQVSRGEHVIVETSMGMEYGEVVISNRQLPQEKIVAPLKKNYKSSKPSRCKTKWRKQKAGERSI